MAPPVRTPNPVSSTTTEKAPKSARIARVILRAVQREPGITRTRLTVQVRPYGPEWLTVLEDLKDRCLVHERPVILHPNGTHKRAAIAYFLAGPDEAIHPNYELATPEEVLEFISTASAA